MPAVPAIAPWPVSELLSDVSLAVAMSPPVAVTEAPPEICTSVVLPIWFTPMPPEMDTLPEPAAPMLAASMLAVSVALAVTEAA